MADGTLKPIADVKLGDKVAATDPDSGKTSPRAVTALHINLDRKLTTVTVAAVAAGPLVSGTASGEGNGDRSTRGPTSRLDTTQNHPFWDAAAGRWVEAKDLEPGKSLLTSPDGQTQLVTAVHNFTGAASMRDLTVANIHTYHVIAGKLPSWSTTTMGSARAGLAAVAPTGRLSLADTVDKSQVPDERAYRRELAWSCIAHTEIRFWIALEMQSRRALGRWLRRPIDLDNSSRTTRSIRQPDFESWAIQLQLVDLPGCPSCFNLVWEHVTGRHVGQRHDTLR